jgi:hypothetical protein
MKKFITIALLSSLFSMAHANEFVMTNADSAKGASGQRFALDFVNSGEAVDLVARITLPDADLAKVDYSNCGKGVPAGFTSMCSVAKGMLIVQVYGVSGVVTALPKGQVSMGTFTVSYSDGKARKLTFAQNDVSSASAAELTSKAEIQ